ncbi:Ig-like domain-containing protein [Candidatus Pantoea soli]|uniref:Bacterial Ig-like domain-containing protein n=1 Tax=Candidatus Pantoea soli TaxID=3098669 RepID=A0A518XFU3_9GAMM|nr:Ig-like domain-containing protein [Pantoea soli]QDY42966.1 hypothetical protein D8B20_14240 [Pantoea soli]
MLSFDASASGNHPLLFPPFIIMAEPGWYNDPQKRWDGRATSPDTVEIIVSVNGQQTQRVPVANGTFSWTPARPLADGEYQLSFVAVDQVGNQSAPLYVSYNIDTQPPARPVIGAIEDDVAGGVDNGNSIKRNGYTNDDQPVVRGQAEANSLVYLYDGTTLLASARTDARGEWQVQLDLPQDGTYQLSAVAEDRADNRSTPSVVWTFHLDTVAPATPAFRYYADDQGLYQGQFDNSRPTDDRRPVLHGEAEAGTSVRIQYAAPGGKWIAGGTASVDGNGHWQWTPPQDLTPDGEWRFRTRSSDKAGNVSPWSDSWTLNIDTRIDTPLILQALDDTGSVQPVLPGQTTDDARLDFSGQSEPSSLVTLYQNGLAVGSAYAAADGRWRITPDREMMPGANSFSVKAVDTAGNVSPLSAPWSVNYAPPLSNTIGCENWDCRSSLNWQSGRTYQYGDLKVTELSHTRSVGSFYTGVMNRPDGYQSRAVEMLDNAVVKFDFGATNYVAFNYGRINNCDSYVNIYSPDGQLLGREYLRPSSSSNREQDFNCFSWNAPAGKQIGYIEVHSGEDPDTYKRVFGCSILVRRDVGWVLDTLRWGKQTPAARLKALPEPEAEEAAGPQLHLTDAQQWLASQAQPLAGFSSLILAGEQSPLDFQQLTAALTDLRHIDLTGQGDNQLVLESASLLQQAPEEMLTTPQRWTIDGDRGDTVQLTDSALFYQQWQQQGTQSRGGKQWQVFESHDRSAQLLIGDEVVLVA